MGSCLSISMSCDNTLSHCCDYTVRQASYVYMLEDNLEELRIKAEELKELRYDVARRVTIEEEKHLRRLDQVHGWLLRVEALIAEVEELIKDGHQEVEKLCVGGCCSKNYKSSYKFGKRVARKLEAVTALKSKGTFEKVAEGVPTVKGDEKPSDPTVGLESMLDKVWSCLTQANTGIIGLYGMGGVGKTTLLTQVNNHILQHASNCFDYVIWVVVSKEHSPEKIQHSIGKKIGLDDVSWMNNSRDEKATDIFRVLSKKRFALMLDDVWERVDLTKIGIPLPNEQNNCKVIFTTRSEEVCGQMKAHTKIKVQCLAWEKAWDLFRANVGEETLNVHPEIPELAKTVAKECGGLPLALITIGRAMTCKKTPQEWYHATVILKNCASQISGMRDEVFPLLKFSYDNLPSKKVKSCFLYCSLFPEDHEIDTTELIDYWIGEGFLEEYDERPRNEGHDVIGTLVYACLLEKRENKVKMHDVIRDMALWIACKCGQVKDYYLVRPNAQLIEAPEVGKWKGVRRMSIMNNYIRKLTKTPTCPGLLTLLLQGNMLGDVSPDFFQFMHRLKVLNLSCNQDLNDLPPGFSKLVSLKYLNLSHTGIRQLPAELKRLVHLKYLNLEHTYQLNTIPPQTISSLVRLQVLRTESSCIDGSELTKELHSLKHLNSLSISLRGSSAIQTFLSFYKRHIFPGAHLLSEMEGLKLLDMLDFENMDHLICRFEDLDGWTIEWANEGGRHRGAHLRNSIRINTGCFNGLDKLWIENIPAVVDLTWISFIPSLHFLSVKKCPEIQEIISVRKLGKVGTVITGNSIPFAKLQTLKLLDLPKLRSIFADVLAFPCLEHIFVHRCPGLLTLPLHPYLYRLAGRVLVIQGEDNWWNNLKWEDEAAKDTFLPCFQSLQEASTSVIMSGYTL